MLKALLETHRMPMAVVRNDGKIAYANTAWARDGAEAELELCFPSPGEDLSAACAQAAETHPQVTALGAAVREALARGHPEPIRYRVWAPEGARWLEVTVVPGEDDGASIAVVSLGDVTEPERLVAALKDAESARSLAIAAERERTNQLIALMQTWLALLPTRSLNEVLQIVTDRAREIVGSHQAATILVPGGDWAHMFHAVSLSEKYEAWRGMASRPDGSGAYSIVCRTNAPIRLSEAELEAHPTWHRFSEPGEAHPPLRGWLAVPLVGVDGRNLGVIQLSDKHEGDFTDSDEAILVHLAQMAATTTEQKMAEEELRRREDELRAVGEVNAHLLDEVRRQNAQLEQRVAKRTEQLALSEARYRTLAEAAPQAIWMADPNGQITYYSPTWYELTGRTVEESLGDRWTEVLHPDEVDEVRERWAHACATGDRYVAESRMRRRDGSYMTASVVGAPVRDATGKILHWVGINTDITAHKGAATQLEAANRELEAFSYSVSHDLRAPLRAIDGFSRILLDDHAETLDDEGRRLLEKVVRNTQQMARLIDDLLAFARVSRRELEPRRVKLAPTARAIAEELRAAYPRREHEVRIGELPDIVGDAPTIRQALYNLIANAFKFSQTREHPVVEVGSFEQQGERVYFVRDNGVGFDSRYAGKLFGVFQRLHSPRDFEGTGVGLAIVKRVVERHGGRVWAEGQPDRGATFYFSVPAGTGGHK